MQYCSCLLQGLAEIHDKNIAHRDLKPANIFVQSKGEDEEILKIGDFGVSLMLRKGKVSQKIIGTPIYMAPELIDGNKYNTKIDIWSLGCILYELCTFKQIITGTDYPSILKQIKLLKIPRLFHYSLNIQNLLDKMLTRSYADRPTAKQLMKYLKSSSSNILIEIRCFNNSV